MDDPHSQPTVEPIALVLDAIGVEEPFPESALRTCVERIDEAAPALLAVLHRAADGEMLSLDEETLLYRGLYILGTARVTDAFGPLLRLLRRDDEELDDLLGDVLFMGVPSILAATYGGDSEALFGPLSDQGLNGTVRSAILDAAAFLCWQGRIEPDRMRGFLTRFHEDGLGGDDEFLWTTWAEAIALLGFRDMRPAVEANWHRIPKTIMELRHFDQDLRDAERAPEDAGRFVSRGLDVLDDVVAALEWSRPKKTTTTARKPNKDRGAQPQPLVNPHRNVGRNDPCPCGSGKKAKKCCLASS